MVGVLANSGGLHPWPDGTRDNSTMLTNLLDAFTVNGKLYAQPKDFNTFAIIYNKDIFDDAGVPYPTHSETFQSLYDKLEAVVEALGREGVSGVCFNPGYAAGFAPLALATGWVPLNEAGQTRLDDRFETAFRFYVSLFERNIAILASSLGHSWSGGCFGSERTAIAIEGNWIAGYLRDKAPNLLYGSATLPAFEGTGEPGNLIFTVGWGINAATPDPELAERVVNLLTSEPAQRWILNSGLALPSGVALAGQLASAKPSDQDGELAQTLYMGVQRGFVRPFSFAPYGDVWMDPINVALSSAIVGGVSVQEAIATAQKSYDMMFDNLQGDSP